MDVLFVPCPLSLSQCDCVCFYMDSEASAQALKDKIVEVMPDAASRLSVKQNHGGMWGLKITDPEWINEDLYYQILEPLTRFITASDVPFPLANNMMWGKVNTDNVGVGYEISIK